MQAASRESYANGVAALDALSGANLTEIADEILSVAGLLVREPRLRRALSDPARPGADRADLVADLLAGRIGETTLGLLRTLVSGRWSAPSELLEATERLGVDAVLAGAEQDGVLGDVEDELFRFGQIIDGSPELAAVFGDLSAPAQRRAELVDALLSGKAQPATVRLAALALEGFGGRSFAASLTRLVELAAQRRDRHVAYVTVATALTEAEEARLGSTLSELYGREVSLKITVDPGILGGLSVQVGHDLFDGTIARRLNETRIALAGRRN